jgi:hypothetical protein
MTENRQEEEYLGLFRPKTAQSDAKASQSAEQDTAGDAPRPPAEGPEMSQDTWADETASDWEAVPPSRNRTGRESDGLGSIFPPARGQEQTLRLVGAAAGGGCLLLLLMAVVVFAFTQVFGRRAGDSPSATASPTAAVAAVDAAPAAVPTRQASSSVQMVYSKDVRVPIALPAQLSLGQTDLAVEAVRSSPDAWPPPPSEGGSANWIYGTVVNYIFGVAPTTQNRNLLSDLEIGDTISMKMSTGVVLDFQVNEILTGASTEGVSFGQISPQLTLALLAENAADKIVVTASFSTDQPREGQAFPAAAVGLMGNTVEKGPVRVTLIEDYQVAAEQAGLPASTGYLLVDVRIENISDSVLEPDIFQTFVSSAKDQRFPLTLMAEQFAHYGMPTEPLAPGETVIGSLGYLVPGVADKQVRWIFNPVPGSDHWIVVPLSYELPAPSPTMAPPPPAGFARVTLDTQDIFINSADNILDIGLRIENVSEGVVQVTREDVGLNSWTDGQLELVAAAPQFPWVVEPRELRLFQLQFRIPSADTALLEVLGYTFSIENLGE